MTRRMLDDLGRARQCLERLYALGAEVQTTFVGRHGPTITLDAPGTLADWLDAQRTPITGTLGAHMALVDGCLVTWPAR